MKEQKLFRRLPIKVVLQSFCSPGAEKRALEAETGLFSLWHFYRPVRMLLSVHFSAARASAWQERSLSTMVPANGSDVPHRFQRQLTTTNAFGRAASALGKEGPEGGGRGDSNCGGGLQGDRGLAHWWLHQNPHITSLQLTKPLTHHVSWDEINLLWGADSDAVCL